MNDKRREPARWIFSSELRECNNTITEGEGDYKREYFVTPGGSVGRRVLFCGKLMAKNEEGDMTKMTVADPTAAFYVTYFSKEFNQDVKNDISKVNVNDEIIVMGRTSYYRTEEGKMYVNINPESVRKIDEESSNYWISRTAFLLQRRLLAIREIRNNPEATMESLMGRGFTEDEATGAMESAKLYPSYDIQRLEEIALSVSVARPSGEAMKLKDDILAFIQKNTPIGGAAYDEIVREFKNRGVSNEDIDETLNVLGLDGEIFEAEKRKFRTT